MSCSTGALLLPSPLKRLPLSPVQEGEHEFPWGISLQHKQPHQHHHQYQQQQQQGYEREYCLRLHSLAIGGESESWGAETEEALFGVFDVPAADIGIAARRRGGGKLGAAARSYSEPLLESAKMASAGATAAIRGSDEGAPDIDNDNTPDHDIAPEADTDTAPSSPPQLSYSKSSKSSSSSIHSDTTVDEEDEPADKEESPSEDVSVVEERRESDDSSSHPDFRERHESDDSNLRPEIRPTLKRPPRSFATDEGMRGVSSIRGGMLRDPAFNSSPPTGLGLLRRGFTSPSTPALFTGAPQGKSSRSPSPTKSHAQNGATHSPQTLSPANSRLSPGAPSPNSNASPVFGRRQSWQPGQRKTARELEAEFNDEEVEVPDDYILENVPISPMPGQPRLPQSLSQPQSRSTTPSPQRRPSYTNLHSANVPKNAKRPSAPMVLPNGQYGSPRSPRQSRPYNLQHAYTMSAYPPGRPLHPKQRSKSWTEDLNEEARRLSAALEEYAQRLSQEQKRENQPAQTNSVSSSPAEPVFLKERARSATFEISQLQRGNMMIDPLPMSKEKEAVLARTRPSWLPPKDLKEDRRHLKEWEQMMARAAEKEKSRALKEQEDRETQDELKGSLARIWEQHVLPNWDVVMKEPRTRELWWRGVTPRSRGVVWQKAIGNELELSEASFSAALARADSLEEKIEQMTDEERGKCKEAAWFAAIERDVPTAFPTAELPPAATAALQSSLRTVLRAYALYRSDVGYVYGTHLIAAQLCLYIPSPSTVFIALANLLNRPVPLAFQIHDTEGMARTYALVLSTLNYKLPSLHAHLTSTTLGLRPEEYLDPIFRTLFAYHLPPAHLGRIWDLLIFEGDKALIRAAVAVLGRLEGRLYGSREEVLDLLGWQSDGRRWDVGAEEEFVVAVREAGKVDPGRGVASGGAAGKVEETKAPEICV